jgi:putative ABC transport system permease protein
MGGGRFGRRWARIVRPDARAEVDEELAFHLAERERDYAARGLDAESARAAAEARLGNLTPVRRECTALLAADRREAARREWAKVSWLDVKLGFRMLLKYPGLTVVGGLAIAFAIWIGAGTFEFVSQVLFPTLPLEDGDRIVGIEQRDVSSGGSNRRLLHDLVTWQGELESVEELGAFRTVARNLVTGTGRGEPVEVAEMSASGFRVARVPPVLGRTLVEADEAPGAPLVAVLGHDVWQARFAGDPDVVGRTIGLGRAQATVVGVMPEGFGFPIAQSLWVPLHLDPLQHERGAGPPLRVFGRLAPGAGLDEAQAELTAIGRRMAVEFPDTHEHLRPRVLPYAKSILGLSGALNVVGIGSINLFAVLLLVLICGNVALLMFARAATREGELVVRSALGASRGRIITQLFAESLVLGVLAAALGLAAAGAGLRWGLRIVQDALLEDRLPFWFQPSLSPTTVLYAIGLTVLVAVITGVLPALKVTGRNVGGRLRQATAGGGGFRFGGIWTFVIVLQVAIMVVFPVVALAVRMDGSRYARFDVGFPTERYLSARIEMDREGESGDTSAAAFAARYAVRLRSLEERLEARPGVTAVTFAERLPLMYHPHRRVEVEGGGAPQTEQEIKSYGDARAVGYRVSSADVALDYLATLDAPVLQGRAFHSGDLAADARAVIVNESFVKRVLGGRSPIGQRIRYMFFEERRGDETFDPAAEPWYEIVGVVRDMGMAVEPDVKVAGIYHPTAPGGTYPMNAAIRVAGEPLQQAQAVRAIAVTIDPSLRLYGVEPLARVVDVELDFYSFWFRLTAMVSGIAMILSLAGIYAVLAYTVSRRTREIGIRVALGADSRRVILAIFRRPLAQVAGGVLLGAAVIATLFSLAMGALTARTIAIVVAYTIVMCGVCALACIGPTRRALSVEPLDALREEQ